MTVQTPIEVQTTPASTELDHAGNNGIQSIDLLKIIPNKYQPRRHLDETNLTQLAESIRRSGVMQPVIVRPVRGTSGGGGGYELVAGERRWRAAQLAGLVRIPALVRDLSDEESAEWAVVENVQREDLNPIERAWAFRSLSEKFGLTHGQIAERIGLERPTVANFIRLTELEEQIQGMIAAGRLSHGHGKVLLGLQLGPNRVKLAEQALNEGWNIRRLERAVAAETAAGEETAPAVATPLRSAAIDDLEKRLGQYLGTKVSLNTDRTGTRGRLTVEFYGLDHFDGMMSKIGFTP